MQPKLADFMKTLKLTGMNQVRERELAPTEKEGLAAAQWPELILLESPGFSEAWQGSANWQLVTHRKATQLTNSFTQPTALLQPSMT
jgi:hypothetical protein